MLSQSRFRIRVLAAIVLQAFLVQEAAFAAPDAGIRLKLEAPAPRLNLPHSAAFVEDFYIADSVERRAYRENKEVSSSTLNVERSTPVSGHPRLIYLVQDAHTNESGQINIAKTIEILVREKGVRTVFTEAGTGDVSLSFLRSTAAPEKRRDVGMQFLRKGLLQGGEFLDLTSELPFKIWGVEDPELYEKAVLTYGKIAGRRGAALDYLSRAEGTLKILKDKVYNPALRAFDSRREAYLRSELSLTGFIEYLIREAANRRVSASGYPHLAALSKIRRMEDAIDFPRAGLEQMEAVAGLDDESRESLLKSVSEREHSPFKLTVEEGREKKAFYALLEDKLLSLRGGGQDPSLRGTARRSHGGTEAISQRSSAGLLRPFGARNDVVAKYPNLFKYIDYLKEAEHVDARAVLEEQKLLEDALFTALAGTADEIELGRTGRRLAAMRAILSLKATPDDFRSLERDGRRAATEAVTGFLNKKIMDLADHFDRAIIMDPEFDETLQTARDFYRLTTRRDSAFLDNLFAKMDADGESEAVLVTGGYHTPNLKELLVSHGVSFISIMPQVLHPTDHARYEKLLLSQTFAPADVRTARGSDAARSEAAMTRQLRDEAHHVLMAGAEIESTALYALGSRLGRESEAAVRQVSARFVSPVSAQGPRQLPLRQRPEALKQITSAIQKEAPSVGSRFQWVRAWLLAALARRFVSKAEPVPAVATKVSPAGSRAADAPTDEEFLRLVEYMRFKDWQIIKNAGSGHPGGSLSSIEVFAALYSDARLLRIDPARDINPDPNKRWRNRDRFVLSKAHVVPGQYAALYMAGLLTRKEIEDLRKDPDGYAQGHATMTTPGIDLSGGVLGYGAPAATGMAIAAAMDGRDYHTFSLIGDGEAAKGPIDEMRKAFPKKGIDNFTAILDYNQYQQTGRSDKFSLTYEQTIEEWRNAGWNVVAIDGEPFSDNARYSKELRQALLDSKTNKNGKPTILIIKSIKGRGITLAENAFRQGDTRFHGTAPKPAEYDAGVREIARRLGIDVDPARNLAYIEAELEIVGDAFRTQFKQWQLTPKEIADIDRQNDISSADARTKRLQAKSAVPAKKTYKAGDKIPTRAAMGDALLLKASQDPDVIFVSPSEVPNSVHFEQIEKTYGAFSSQEPQGRLVSLGIMEDYGAAVAIGISAAGLGFKVVAASFDRFLSIMASQIEFSILNKIPVGWIGTHAGSETGDDGGGNFSYLTPALMSALSDLNRNMGIWEPSDAIGTDIYIDRMLRTLESGKSGYLRLSRAPRLVRDRAAAVFDGEAIGVGYAVWKEPAGNKKPDIILAGSGATVTHLIEAAGLLEAKGIPVRVIDITSLSETSQKAPNQTDLSHWLTPGVPVYAVYDGAHGVLYNALTQAAQSTRSFIPVYTRGISNWGSAASLTMLQANRFTAPFVADDADAVLKHNADPNQPLPDKVYTRAGSRLSAADGTQYELMETIDRLVVRNPDPLSELLPDLPATQLPVLSLDRSGEVGKGNPDLLDTIATSDQRAALKSWADRENVYLIVGNGEGLKDVRGQQPRRQLMKKMLWKGEGFGPRNAPRKLVGFFDPLDGTGNTSKWAPDKEGNSSSLMGIGDLEDGLYGPDEARALVVVYNGDLDFGAYLDKVAFYPGQPGRTLTLEEAARRFIEDFSRQNGKPLVHLMDNGTFDKPAAERKAHRHLELYDTLKESVDFTGFKSGSVYPMLTAAVPAPRGKQPQIALFTAGFTEGAMAASALAHDYLRWQGTKVYLVPITESAFYPVRLVHPAKRIYERTGADRTVTNLHNLVPFTSEDLKLWEREKIPGTRRKAYKKQDLTRLQDGWVFSNVKGNLKPLHLFQQTLHLPSKPRLWIAGQDEPFVNDGIQTLADGSKVLQTVLINHRGFFLREQRFMPVAASGSRVSFKDLGGIRSKYWWQSMEPERRALLRRFLGTQGTEPVNTIPFDHHKPKDHYGHEELTTEENMLLIANSMASYVDKYLIHPGYLLGRYVLEENGKKTRRFMPLRDIAKLSPEQKAAMKFSRVSLHPKLPKDKLYVLKWEGEKTPNGDGENTIGKRPTNQGEELGITASDVAAVPQVIGLKFMTYVDSSQPDTYDAIMDQVIAQSGEAHNAGLLFFPEDLPAKTVSGKKFEEAFESQEGKLTDEGKRRKALWEAGNPLLFAAALDLFGVDYDAYKFTFPGNLKLMSEEVIRQNLRRMAGHTRGRFVMMLSGGRTDEELKTQAQMSAEELNFVGNFAGRGVWQKSFTSVPSDPSNKKAVSAQIARNLKEGDALKQFNLLETVKLQRPWWEYLSLTAEEAGIPPAGARTADAPTDEEFLRLAEYLRFKDWQIIKYAGSGHAGGSLSAIEIFAALYSDRRLLRIDPARDMDPNFNNRWKNRDRFVLSKAHVVPGQYAALYLAGLLTRNEIEALRKDPDGFAQGHATMTTPGIDLSGGVLGYGAPAATGMAIAAAMDGRDYHTFSLVGDGEAAKGPMDEMRKSFPKQGRDNFTAILDFNQYQQTERSDNYGLTYEQTIEDWRNAGWNVVAIDGEHFSDNARYSKELRQALLDSKTKKNGRPTILIIKSIKGRGITLAEDAFRKGDTRFHGAAPKPAEYDAGVREIARRLGIDVDPARNLAYIEADLETVGDAFRPQFKEWQLTPAEIAEIDRQNDISSADARTKRLQAKIAVPAKKTYKPGDKVPTRAAVGDALLEKAGQDPDLVFVSPSEVKNSVHYEQIGKTFGIFGPQDPQGRLVDLGIMEDYGAAVAIGISAAGLGFKVVAASFDRFLSIMASQIEFATLNKIAVGWVGTHAGAETGEDGGGNFSNKTPALMSALSDLGQDMDIWEPSDAIGTDIAVDRMLLALGSGKSGYLRASRNARLIRDRAAAVSNGEASGAGYVVWKEPAAGQKPGIVLAGSGATVTHLIEAAGLLEAKGIPVRVIDITSLSDTAKKALDQTDLSQWLTPDVPVYAVYDGAKSVLYNALTHAAQSSKAFIPIYARGITNSGSAPSQKMLEANRFTAPFIADDAEAILKHRADPSQPIPGGVFTRAGARIVALDRMDLGRLNTPGVVDLSGRKSDDEIIAADPQIVLLRSSSKLDSDLMSRLHSLKEIIRLGHGLDNVDVEYAKKNGIKVTGTKGSKKSMAGLALRMALIALQGDETAQTDEAPAELLTIESFVKALEFKLKGKADADDLRKMAATILRPISGKTFAQVKGMTIGVIGGTGDIGGEVVALAAQVLGMNVLVNSRGLEASEEAQSKLEVGRFATKQEIYGKAHFVVLQTGLSDETKGMIDKDAVDAMIANPDLIALINADREGLVIESEVVRLVDAGKKYIVDELPKLAALKAKSFYLPHIGGSTPEAEEGVFEGANAALASAAAGARMKEASIVHSPAVDHGPSTMDQSPAGARIQPSILTEKLVPAFYGPVASALATRLESPARIALALSRTRAPIVATLRSSGGKASVYFKRGEFPAHDSPETAYEFSARDFARPQASTASSGNKLVTQLLDYQIEQRSRGEAVKTLTPKDTRPYVAVMDLGLFAQLDLMDEGDLELYRAYLRALVWKALKRGHVAFLEVPGKPELGEEAGRLAGRLSRLRQAKGGLIADSRYPAEAIFSFLHKSGVSDVRPGLARAGLSGREEDVLNFFMQAVPRNPEKRGFIRADAIGDIMGMAGAIVRPERNPATGEITITADADIQDVLYSVWSDALGQKGFSLEAMLAILLGSSETGTRYPFGPMPIDYQKVFMFLQTMLKDLAIMA